MAIGSDFIGKKVADYRGFEDLKESYVASSKKQEQQEVNQAIDSCVDVGLDSYYPLVTDDPALKVEFTKKIHREQLNNVFDPQNQNKFNL
jgi:hypothetical protein